MSTNSIHQPANQQPDKYFNGSDIFTTLYEEYAARIFTYLQYRCGDSNTAQDLAAEVFERALSALPGYDEQRAPLPAWLFAIARHVVTDWQRRQYLRRFIPWENFSRRASVEAGPEQYAVESEERRLLRLALRGLSNRERDVIGLRFSSGLTNREIARLTGLSESNVAVILYRSLRKLRERLADPVDLGSVQPVPLVEVDND